MKFSLKNKTALAVFCVIVVFLGMLISTPSLIQNPGDRLLLIARDFAAVALLVILGLLLDFNHRQKKLCARDKEMSESSSYLLDLYNDAPCGYLTVDPCRNITRINQTLLHWLGYEEKEVLGRFKFEDFLEPRKRADYLATYQLIFKKYMNERSIRDREFDFQRKNGSVFNVTLSSIAKYADDGTYMEGWSTLVDSTERKRAEQEIITLNQNLESTVLARTRQLAESERIYRSLATNIPGSAITLLDRDERYLLAEGEMLAKMGYDKSSMPGKTLSDVITAENYEFYGPIMRRAFGGEHISMEKRTLSGFDVLITVVPLRNEDEQIFAVMFVYIDISDFKESQAALQRLNNTLENKVHERTAQLNELNQELESFTYSVSHDLRAPLRAVSGYAQMLKEDYSVLIGIDGARMIDLVIANGVRMGKLIDDLLEFSRLGRKSLHLDTIDMDSVVKEVLAELKVDPVNKKATVSISPLEPAPGDRSMIKQVWVNLLSNALKYSSRKDHPAVQISSVRREDDVCYAVSDNGAGFNMAYADKLFNVFQRLHKINDFEGTGVGLALVKTIIKKHGGHVSAEGQPDAGATFRFTLPIDLVNNE